MTLIATTYRYISMTFILKTLIVFTAIRSAMTFPFQFSILVYCFDYIRNSPVQNAFNEP